MRPTAPLSVAIRRLRLTTKQAGKDYYKGTGTGSTGHHDKWGRYWIDREKVRTYKCPDLTDFHLSPFVASRIEKRRDTFAHTETGNPMDGKDYLKRWKEHGGTI